MANKDGLRDEVIAWKYDTDAETIKALRDMGDTKAGHLAMMEEWYDNDEEAKTLVQLILTRENAARLDELEIVRDHWHGTDDNEFAKLMNDRRAELKSIQKGKE